MFSLKTHFSFGAVVVLRSTIMKYWLLISKFLLSSSLVWFGTLEIGKCSLVITNGWFHSFKNTYLKTYQKYNIFWSFSSLFLPLFVAYQNIDFRLLWLLNKKCSKLQFLQTLEHTVLWITVCDAQNWSVV